jgi:protein-tyrosine-phosphatase
MKAMKYNAASEPAVNIELSIDERHALRSAAERLQSEFAGAFDAQTVERLVHSSYDTLAAHATVRDFLALLAERGIDISGEYPKPWTGEIFQAADVVVGMGCGDTGPCLPGLRYEDWDLDDPAGKDVAAIRPIRDEIERRVRQLLDDLRIPYHS